MALLCPRGSPHTGLQPQPCLHAAGHVQHFPAVLVTCHGIERSGTTLLPPGGWAGATGTLLWGIRNPLGHIQAEVQPQPILAG